jgi:hypothetical protein
MRADNNEPHKVYHNYGDWLFNDHRHTFWIISLFFGYFYYLRTTTEV